MDTVIYFLPRTKLPAYCRAFILMVIFLFASAGIYAQTITSAATGNWSSTSTWVGGVVPASTDNVVIAAGHTVTLDNTFSCRSLSITGTLTMGANTLTVAIASQNNTSLTVNSGGTLTVSGGNLIVNGNVSIAGIFNQSGGTITVDGNNAGNSATSVATGTSIFGISSSAISLTDGTLLILDPHVGTSTTTDYVFSYSNSTTISLGVNHTLQIGDGTSTDNTANTAGFLIEPFVSTGRLILGKLTVNCAGASNRFVTFRFPSQIIQLLSDLTITSGELRGPSTGTVAVAGNIVNNGILTTTGTLALQSGTGTSTAVASALAQTISGSGTFRNLTTSPTANFTSITVNNTNSSGVTFSGAGWNSVSNATVSGTLTFTAGTINTSGGIFTLGVSGTAAGTLSYTSGGFTSGSIFTRWFTTTAVTITSVTGRFPFVNASGQVRDAFLGYSTALATAGWVQIQFNEVAGNTTVSIGDVFPIVSRNNSNWVVSTGGSLAVSANNDAQLRIRGDGMFTLTSTSIPTFLMVGAAARANGFSGSGTGSITAPEANKTGLSTAGLAQTVYAGIGNIISSTSTGGAWENTGTWTGGVVPSCSDVANIISGAIVTVNGASSNAGALTINSGGTLNVSGNTLTVGCSSNNASLTNNGTLNVSAGSVVINGNLAINNASNFAHSGGTITINGHNGGALGNNVSVASGIPLFAIGTSGTSYSSGTTALSGGTIIIVDPHIGSSTNTNAYAVYANLASGVNITATGAHTFQFGDGTSTRAGGSTTGFNINPFIGSGYLAFRNVTITGSSTGSNRQVSALAQLGILGTLTTSGTTGELNFNGNQVNVAGDITNNGIITANALLGLQTYSSATPSVSNNAQTISGSGTFRNLSASPTANFNGLIINNIHTSGIVFSNANTLLSGTNTGTVSGAITFSNGIVNLSSGTFILGTGTTGIGTMTYTSGGFTNGSFRRFVAAAALAGGSTGMFPFSISGANRNLQITTTAIITTAGSITVSHTNSAGYGTVTGTDPSGSIAFNRLTNSTWTVSTANGIAGGTYSLNASGDGLVQLSSIASEPRLVQSSVAGVGTHGAPGGTVSVPTANRTGLSLANLTNSFALGFNAINLSTTIFSVQSGAWESASTWSTGAVPTSSDNVSIAAGTTVTVNATASAASTLVVNGTLTVSGSTLNITATTSGSGVTMGSAGIVNINGGAMTVGTGANRFSTFATGAAATSQLNVSSGSLTINGNLNIQSPATFAQSGGTITVDGNAAGVAANSVASGTAIVNIASANLNLTGGLLIITDPHANATSATNITNRAFAYNVTTTHYNSGVAHTVQFGDGTSTDAGGFASGFVLNNAVTTGVFAFGNVSVVGSATGSNRLVTNVSQIGIAGNLTTSGVTGEFSSAAQVNVAGNITNNGILTLTSTLAFQNFQSNVATAATSAQTLSGSGTFRNLSASPTANFTNITINNTNSLGVTFSGTGWNSMSNATVSGTLAFTTGLINTSGGIFTLGISGTAAGTLSYTAGGFTTGSIFTRWFATATVSIGGVGGRFPFVNASGQVRDAFFGYASALTNAGWLQIQYNEVAGNTAVSISDINTVTSRSNSNWVISQSTSLVVSPNNDAQLRIRGDGMFTLGSAASFLMVRASSQANGVSSIGTGTTLAPEANKTGLGTTGLTQTVYGGTANIITSTSTGGAWENTGTWVGGIVPSCNDAVSIVSGATVTVNSASANSALVTVNSGGTLIVSGNTLTVGCTNNNASLNNNGTLTVSAGALVVNGNLAINNASNFTHSGGTITIDGHNGSSVGNSFSVASGTPLFAIGTSGVAYATGTTTLSGGTIVIVDPHIGSSTSANAVAVYANLASGININPSGTHTFQFGDGTSTNAGGSTGFNISPFIGSGYLAFRNVTITGSASGLNRQVTALAQLGILGNLTTSGTTGELDFNSNQVNIAGNITNNGIITASALLGLQTFSAATATVSANAQTISGSGTFRNARTSATATFNGLTINNSNVTGVTFSSPAVVSFSGAVTNTLGTVAYNNATSITIQSTYTNTAGNVTFGAAPVVITGAYTNTAGNVVFGGATTFNGTYTHNAGTVTFNANSTLNGAATVTTGNITIGSGSTLTANAAVTVSVADGIQGAGNFTIASTSALLTIGGTGPAIQAGLTGASIRNAGTIIINTVNITLNGTSSGQSTGTSFPTSFTSGTVNLNTAGGTTITQTTSFFNLASTAVIIVPTGVTATIIAGGSLSPNNAAASITVVGTLQVNGTVTFGTSATVTGAGTFTLGSGATLITAHLSGTETSGSVQTSTRNFNSAANYTFNGASTQVSGTGLPSTLTGGTVTFNTGTSNTLSQTTTFNNLVTITAFTSCPTITVNGTFTMGAAFTTANSITLNGTSNINNTLTVNTSGTLTINGTAILGTNTIAGTGAFTTGANSIMSLGNTHASGVVQAATNGNILITGTRTWNSGTSFIITGSAVATGTSMPASIGTLTINTSTNVTLSQATTATGLVMLNSGNLVTTSSLLLTVNTNNPANVSRGGLGYVNGPMAWILPANVLGLCVVGDF